MSRKKLIHLTQTDIGPKTVGFENHCATDSLNPYNFGEIE